MNAPGLKLPEHTVARLGNGLRVLMVPHRRLPALSLSLVLPRGALAEPAGQDGVASMTVQMLNQGSRQTDARSLAAAVDDLGATYSTSTGWDSLSVSLVGLSPDAGRLLELLAEITLTPTFPAAEMEALKRRRLSRLARAVDQPGALADRALATQLYLKHPYARPAGGDAGSVAALSTDDLTAWHGHGFSPAGAWLAVAGDFEPRDMLQALEESFGAWAGTGPPDLEIPLPVAAEGSAVTLVHRPGLAQAQIRWGHVGLPDLIPDLDLLDAVNDPLGGGGFSSRLMQEIRSSRGLTYGVSSGWEGRRHAGPFSISTFTPAATVDEVIGLCDEIVREYVSKGPSPEELHSAVSRLAGGYPLRFETPAQAAARILERELYDLPGDCLETYPARLRTLTAEEAHRLAVAHLHPDRRHVVVVADAGDVRDTLARRGPLAELDARALFGLPGER